MGEGRGWSVCAPKSWHYNQPDECGHYQAETEKQKQGKFWHGGSAVQSKLYKTKNIASQHKYHISIVTSGSFLCWMSCHIMLNYLIILEVFVLAIKHLYVVVDYYYTCTCSFKNLMHHWCIWSEYIRPNHIHFCIWNRKKLTPPHPVLHLRW